MVVRSIQALFNRRRFRPTVLRDGRAVLATNPDFLESLGLAISVGGGRCRTSRCNLRAGQCTQSRLAAPDDNWSENQKVVGESGALSRESSLVSRLYHEGFIEAQAFDRRKIFEAAVTFAKTEGIIPTPESAHAIGGAIIEALKAKEAGQSRVILFSLSGHGHFNMAADTVT